MDLSPQSAAVAKAQKLIILANRLLKIPNFFQRLKTFSANHFQITFSKLDV